MSGFFKDLMHKATQLTREGRLHDATAAIQRALGMQRAPATAPRDITPTTETIAITPVADAIDITPVVAERDESDAGSAPIAEPVIAMKAAQAEPAIELPMSAVGGIYRSAPQAPDQQLAQAQEEAIPVVEMDQFVSGKHMDATLSCNYRLYMPPRVAGQQLPLVVMLHGCNQDPDDFAAGTQMNELARLEGCFVLYPEQSGRANPNRCWNWFSPHHQQRGSGEPALLASLTEKIIAQYDIDPRRVYIAGLSAGGAMAAIVAAAYPDLFAAVGVHSGLPQGAASNVAEAFAVMKKGEKNKPMYTWPGQDASAATRPAIPVPTIVFHGDADRTVHPSNGAAVIAAALGDVPRVNRDAAARTEQGVSERGTRYSRSTHHDDGGKVLAEHWLVHGAGHAWSGGHADGSYTDASGPDATREMLRFFFENPRADDTAH